MSGAGLKGCPSPRVSQVRCLLRRPQKPLHVFANVEENIAKMQALGGVTDEQLAKWDADLKSIVKTTGESLSEVTEGMYFITSAGFEGAEALAILEMSAKIAATGITDVKGAADLLTSVMGAYGAGAISAGAATDQFVAAIQEGKLEPESFGNALSQVLPFAAELGVEFGEVAGMMAAMSQQGIKAEQSSTALKQIFNKLLKPTEAGKKALEKYGLSVDDVKKMVEEDGLLAALESLRIAFDGDEEAMGAVFESSQALLGVFALTGDNAAKNAEIIDNVSNATGNADIAFRRMQETLKAHLQQAMVNLGLILEDVGERLAPMAKDILTMAGTVLAWYEALGEGPKEFVATILAAGPALIGMSVGFKVLAFLLGGVTPKIGLLLGALGPLKVAMKALWGLMMANPFLALLTAVLAAIVYWDELGELFRKAKQWFLDTLEAWGIPIDGIFGWIGDQWQGALDFIANIDWTAVGHAVGEAMRAIVTKAVAKFKEVWALLWTQFNSEEGLLPSFDGLGEKIIDIVLAGLKASALMLIGFFEGLFGFEEGSIGAAIKSKWDAITAIFSEPISGVFDWIGEAWDDLMDKLLSLIPGIVKKVLGIGDDEDIGGAAVEAIGKGVEEKRGWFGRQWDKAFGDAEDRLPESDAKTGPLSHLTASGAAIMTTLAEGVRQGAGALDAALLDGFSNLSAFQWPVAPQVGFASDGSGQDGQARNVTVTIERIEVMTNATNAEEIANALPAPLEESIRRAVESADSRILV